MRKTLQTLPVISAAFTMMFVLTVPAPAAVSPKQVDDTINKAIRWLYSQQKEDGWESQPNLKSMANRGHDGGMTALAVYALLAAGENPQAPALAKAIDHLKKLDLVGVYPLAVRCQVWLHLPQKPEIVAAMRNDANRLLAMVKTQGEARGMFSYTATFPGSTPSALYSHSRSQYGVLGLWAAAQAGIEVPDAFWQMAEQGWIDHQDSSGGWSYLNKATGPGGVTPGMTAPGIATLLITQEYLHASDECRGNLPQPQIDKGLDWLAKNFDKVASDKRYSRDFPYATLFAVERAALASGLKRFGNVDWYEQGAQWLIKTQKSAGSFAAPGGVTAGNSALTNVPDTCFALLFLSRGRAPVIVNKLRYAISDPQGKDKGKDKLANWNERSRDVANITRWFGRQTERFFNWQIVDLQHPDDLDDAPILYISGNQALAFTPEETAELRRYVEEGGLIVGNADCGAKPFANSFQKLAAALFPAYEFRELPTDHSIYTAQQFNARRWQSHPRLLGLSNGVRELMLLLPQDDPAKFWQTQSFTRRVEAVQLPANIFLYATDKLSQGNKGETTAVKLNPDIQPKRTITIARLQYNGNWNPEPGGWRRLANLLHNRHATDLKISTVNLGQGKLADVNVAHLTGTTTVKFDDNSRAELKAFVDKGGLLIVDAAGGSTEFAESINAELTRIFGDDANPSPQTLAADHPAYTAAGKLPPSLYRGTALTLGANAVPRLRGITRNGKLAVVFSREDLSNALLARPVSGVNGYTPDAAETIACGLLLNHPSPK